MIKMFLVFAAVYFIVYFAVSKWKTLDSFERVRLFKLAFANIVITVVTFAILFFIVQLF